MFKSIESFTGTDPNAGVALEAIRPYSHRAFSLTIRNSPTLKGESGSHVMLAC
jgi:hypothetical protein